MPQHEAHVIGIMIGAEYKDFKLYQVSEGYTNRELNGTYSSDTVSGSAEESGIENIVRFLKSIKVPAATQFYIVYDVNCPKKEDYLSKVLTGLKRITKTDAQPILISIGHETEQLNESITQLISSIKEVEVPKKNKDDNKNEVENEETLRKKLFLSIINKELRNKISLEKKKTDFSIQLNIIGLKAKYLKDNGHEAASKKAYELHSKLVTHSETYFANPTQEAYVAFKNQAKDEIKKAHSELDKHRGWKRVLGNIGLALLGFGIFYLVALAINRNVFFNKTDSNEKLNNLEKLFDNNIYQMR